MEGQDPESTDADSPAFRLEADASLDVTVVVPFYNPGPRVRETVDGLIKALVPSGRSFEIIAVSDGATDGSERALVGAPAELVRCLRLEHNCGKGAALRAGFEQGRGRWLAFIDADGDLPPEQIAAFLECAEREQPDILVGSKRHVASRAHVSVVRRLYSVLWQYVVCVPFHLNVRDTQTGLKAARREVLQRCLPRMVETSFDFDLELLLVARQLGYRQVVEAPVQIVERTSSTVSAVTGLGMLVGAFRIYLRAGLGRAYGEPARRRWSPRAPDACPMVDIDLASGHPTVGSSAAS
jgi:glycosyltransferase involved in cell wall biosynthesis